MPSDANTGLSGILFKVPNKNMIHVTDTLSAGDLLIRGTIVDDTYSTTREFDQQYNGCRNLELLCSQLSAPWKNRPVSRNGKNLNGEREHYTDPRTGQKIQRKIKKYITLAQQTGVLHNPPRSEYYDESGALIQRGVSDSSDRGKEKFTKFTKKRPCSLVNKKGEFKPFLTNRGCISLLFDGREVHLKGERYIFRHNASTDRGSWIGKNAYITQPSVLYDELKTEINAPNYQPEVNNELLVGLSLESLVGFACTRPDDLSDRLLLVSCFINERCVINQLRSMSGDNLIPDVPLVLMDGHSLVQEYTIHKIREDLTIACESALSSREYKQFLNIAQVLCSGADLPDLNKPHSALPAQLDKLKTEDKVVYLTRRYQFCKSAVVYPDSPTFDELLFCIRSNNLTAVEWICRTNPTFLLQITTEKNSALIEACRIANLDVIEAILSLTPHEYFVKMESNILEALFILVRNKDNEALMKLSFHLGDEIYIKFMSKKLSNGRSLMEEIVGCSVQDEPYFNGIISDPPPFDELRIMPNLAAAAQALPIIKLDVQSNNGYEVCPYLEGDTAFINRCRLDGIGTLALNVENNRHRIYLIGFGLQQLKDIIGETVFNTMTPEEQGHMCRVEWPKLQTLLETLSREYQFCIEPGMDSITACDDFLNFFDAETTDGILELIDIFRCQQHFEAERFNGSYLSSNEAPGSQPHGMVKTAQKTDIYSVLQEIIERCQYSLGLKLKDSEPIGHRLILEKMIEYCQKSLSLKLEDEVCFAIFEILEDIVKEWEVTFQLNLKVNDPLRILTILPDMIKRTFIQHTSNQCNDIDFDKKRAVENDPIANANAAPSTFSLVTILNKHKLSLMELLSKIGLDLEGFLKLNGYSPEEVESLLLAFSLEVSADDSMTAEKFFASNLMLSKLTIEGAYNIDEAQETVVPIIHNNTLLYPDSTMPSKIVTISLTFNENGMPNLIVSASGERGGLDLQELWERISQRNSNHGACEACVGVARNGSVEAETGYLDARNNDRFCFGWMVNKKLHRCFNGAEGPDSLTYQESLALDPTEHIHDAGYTLYEGFEAILNALPEDFKIQLNADFFKNLQKFTKESVLRYSVLLETLNLNDGVRNRISLTPGQQTLLYYDNINSEILKRIHDIYKILITEKNVLIELYLAERRANEPHDGDQGQATPLNNSLATVGDVSSFTQLLTQHKNRFVSPPQDPIFGVTVDTMPTAKATRIPPTTFFAAGPIDPTSGRKDKEADKEKNLT